MMGAVNGWKRGAELGLLAVGVLAALVVGEVAARLFRSARRDGGGYAPVRTDTRERRPINARGYRDLERAIPKPPGVRRVVCLGDSFTWGVGVLFDDAWPQRVERLLAREGGRWEAVNLGEPGLNTAQEAAKLAGEGLAYEPDVVVLAYVLNDSEDANAAEARRAADWLEEKHEAASGAPVAARRLGARFRSCAAASGRRWRTAAGSPTSTRCTPRATRAGRPARRRCERSGACAARAACLSSSRSSRCSATSLDESYPFAAEHAKVAQAAAEAGARVLDLLPQYRGLDWRLLVVDGADDEHPNEIAHRIAAQAIAREVEEVLPRAEVAGAAGRP